jgi:hypothetical protein
MLLFPCFPASVTREEFLKESFANYTIYLLQPGDAGARNPETVTLPVVEAIKLDVTQPDDIAFASTLAANGGGAELNVLSIASWISSPQLAIYSASKAAAWGPDQRAVPRMARTSHSSARDARWLCRH